MKDDKPDPTLYLLTGLLLVFTISCVIGFIIATTPHNPPPSPTCIRVTITEKTIQNNKCMLYSQGSLFVCTEWVYSEVRVGHVYVLQFDATQSTHRIVIRAIEE